MAIQSNHKSYSSSASSLASSSPAILLRHEARYTYRGEIHTFTYRGEIYKFFGQALPAFSLAWYISRFGKCIPFSTKRVSMFGQNP